MTDTEIIIGRPLMNSHLVIGCDVEPVYVSASMQIAESYQSIARSTNQLFGRDRGGSASDQASSLFEESLYRFSE